MESNQQTALPSKNETSGVISYRPPMLCSIYYFQFLSILAPTLTPFQLRHTPLVHLKYKINQNLLRSIDLNECLV
jgi:hypothetical protein